MQLIGGFRSAALRPDETDDRLQMQSGSIFVLSLLRFSKIHTGFAACRKDWPCEVLRREKVGKTKSWGVGKVLEYI